MAKQQILLVDADSSSARVLEVSLRSAGFTVTTADSAENALEKLEHGAPDLILTDTRLPGADGFAFVRGLRARPELQETPIVFLTEQGALEDKLRGLELGVDDYLAKPIFVREVVTRVHMLLARKNQQRIATESQARTRFSGSLEDVAVVDLLQTIAVSGKSGVASVRRGDREAQLYFKNGQLVDAEVGDLRGEEAVYRTITWTTGSFDLEFRAVDRPSAIEVTTNALLMEGLRRVDELGRLAEQLPPENTVVDVDHDALLARLNEIPDELNGILRLIDGKRTLLDLIDGSPFDDLSTLTVLSKFYFEGLLVGVEAARSEEEAPQSGPVPDSLRAASDAVDTASLVLEPSAPVAPPVAAAVVPPAAPAVASGVAFPMPAAAPARAETKSASAGPVFQGSAVPDPTRVPPKSPSAPPTQRAPEPPQAVRVVVPLDSDLPPTRNVSASAAASDGVSSGVRAPLAAGSAAPTTPARPLEERAQQPAPQAPVVRIASPAPLADQPKVTPKVILNVGGEPPSSSKTPARGAPAPSRTPSRADVPAAAEPHHYTNGHSNGAGDASKIAPAPARAEPVSAAPFPLSSAREATPARAKPEQNEPAAPAPAVSQPPVVSQLPAVSQPPVVSQLPAVSQPPAVVASAAPAPVSTGPGPSAATPAPAVGDSDAGLTPFLPVAVLEAPARSPETRAEPPVAGASRPREADSSGAEEEATPASERNAKVPELGTGQLRAAGAQRPLSEDEFFDAGEQGTYLGGPRSSIPAPDSDSDSEAVVEHVFRSTPAHRARVRRTTRIVAGILIVAAASVAAAVWQIVRTPAAPEAELAREDVDPPLASESAREGWPALRVPPSEAHTGAADPAPEATAEPAAEQPSPAAADPALTASVVAEPAAAVDPSQPVEPTAAAASVAAQPSSSPTPVPSAAGAVPAAPRPEPKRAAAAPKRARADAPEPATSKSDAERSTLVPRRSSAEKPPTASYPPL